MTKLKLTLFGLASFAVAVQAQFSLPIETTVTGTRGFGDATGSARIMSSNGPAHLGGGNISGVVPLSSGGTFNSTGDIIVGDNAGNSFNFSLALQFTTTSQFRTAVANGGSIIFSGTTLYAADQGFGPVPVTTGNVDWAPIRVNLASYGNSTTGLYGDSNDFRPHAAFNGTDTDNNSTTLNAEGPAITFDGDPYSGDSTFSVDLTSLFTTTGTSAALSASDDRVMLVLGAWTSDGSVILSNDGVGDRIAFQPGSFQLTAVPEPSTYAAILGLIALVGVAYHRRRKS